MRNSERVSAGRRMKMKTVKEKQGKEGLDGSSEERKVEKRMKRGKSRREEDRKEL